MADDQKSAKKQVVVEQPEREKTRDYTLKPGFIHFHEGQEVGHGDAVPLTDAQYLAFSDRFQPVMQTGGEPAPTVSAAPSQNWHGVLAGAVPDIKKLIDGLETPAQIRELVATEMAGQNRAQVLEHAAKKLQTIEK
jgi:hypothetical protein